MVARITSCLSYGYMGGTQQRRRSGPHQWRSAMLVLQLVRYLLSNMIMWLTSNLASYPSLEPWRSLVRWQRLHPTILPREVHRICLSGSSIWTDPSQDNTIGLQVSPRRVQEPRLPGSLAGYPSVHRLFSVHQPPSLQGFNSRP